MANHLGPDRIAPISRSSLARDAAEALRARIVEGQLPAGTRLVERELAFRLRTSRTPVREALGQLARQGLVTPLGTRGFVVTPLSDAEVQEIYPLIAALERVAVERVAEVRQDWLSRLAAQNVRFERAAHNRRRIVADSAWHHTLTAESGNESLLRTLSDLKLRAQRYEYAFFYGNEEHETSVEEHRRIHATLERGETSRAAQRVEAHWLDSMEAVCEAARKQGS